MGQIVNHLSPSPLHGVTGLIVPVDFPLFDYEQMPSMIYQTHGMVYALVDGRDRKIFYFGMTLNPNNRFLDRFKHMPANWQLQKKIKECGRHLQVWVIASKPRSATTKRHLLALERDLIMYFGDQILNIVHNGFA